VAISSLFAQETLPGDLFEQQLKNSCKANLQVIKSVQDLNTSSQITETKSFQTDSSEACQLNDELIHAFLFYYGARKIRDYYKIEQLGDTLFASLLPEKTDASPLLLQKILLSADGKTLLYVESKIKRAYWLFTSASHIQVSFDEKGLYESHKLETRTDVKIIGDGVNVRIKGMRE
jgi:hypothetical protein